MLAHDTQAITIAAEPAAVREFIGMGRTCLDREERVIFVLGNVVELPGEQAAEIIGVTHDVYRKRLSRVLQRIRTAVSNHCGLVNSDAACRCHRRVDAAIKRGTLHPDQLRFVDPVAVKLGRTQIQGLCDVTALFRSAGVFDSPADLGARVLHMLETTPGLVRRTRLEGVTIGPKSGRG